MLESKGHRNAVRKSDGKAPKVRALIVDLGSLVGSHLSFQQPLAGPYTPAQIERLHWAIQMHDSIGEKKHDWNYLYAYGPLKGPRQSSLRSGRETVNALTLAPDQSIGYIPDPRVAILTEVHLV